MKIGIDARFYGPFGKGLGRYTERLIHSLERIDTKNEYYIFLRKENFDAYIPQGSRFKKILADFQWYTLEEQREMPRVLNEHALDLVHFPHFNVPLMYRKPFVVTIHDLIIMRFPTKKATTLGPLKYKFKQWGYKTVIRSAVKRSKKVITVSNYSRSELAKYFHVPKEKVVVTYEAIDENDIHCRDFASVKEKFSINEPYLLYVGNVYPHKNIERLVRAFKRARENPELKNIHLTIVCKEDYFLSEIKKIVKNECIDNVNFTGYISDDELACMYSNSLAYVFPSLYEGFGLPPLEAMGHGIPVIASNTTCIPEILGDAAAYFDPMSVDDIVGAITKIAVQSELRESLIEKGKNRVKEFSWNTCAKQTLAVYKQALE
ncbi:glycosyltransferase family 4 protein [Patescibacteria group bacterium]|nr:glycosyltransferase family 4 protein [Patescibacteria group bacterium]